MRLIQTTKYHFQKLIFFGTAFFVLYACTTTKKVAEINTTLPLDLSEVAIFSYGEDSVIADDFLYAYQKNNGDSIKTYQDKALESSVENYLELYINFKLKVKAAYASGINQKPAFQQEFNKYRKQLAKPYLVENRFKEMLVQEAYDRLKEEIHASHILINVPQGTQGNDTLQYYQKADSLRTLAQNGVSFAMLAEKYSDDPSAAQNGGNLGYFSGLQMVYPFENAAYHTPVGSISEPVRTNFGYHIIKVDDRRPYQGQVKVAHIMIRFDEGQDETEESKSYQKALQIYNELEQGADWAEMTERFSEDLSTRSSGGEFPYFTAGGTLNNFEETAFRLKEIGEISKPVKTRYGWHIIKLIDRKGLEPFDMLQPLIERKVESNLQHMEVQDKTVDMLKIENHYVPNKLMISQAVNYLKNSPEIAKPNSVGVLFSISDTVFTFSAFENYLKEQEISLPVDSSRATHLYASFEESSILEYEEAHLTDKYPEFRRLIQEYKEGILLFDIMEEKVWAKASNDEAALKRFYENHLGNYQWEDRVDATIIDAKDQQVLNEAVAMIGQKKINNALINEVESKFNKDSPLNLQIHKDIYEKGGQRTEAESVIDKINWKVGKYEYSKDARFYFIIVHQVLESSQKNFDEVKGKVISDLQDDIDKAWIQELRSRYPVSIHKEVMAQMIDQLKEENE